MIAGCERPKPSLPGGGGDTAHTVAPPQNNGLPVWGYTVVNTYPHDPMAFTEGLFVHDGMFYESTGMPDSSTLRRVDISTGNVVKLRKLDSMYFGEGLAMVGSRLYQLTWRTNRGFVYDAKTFEPVDTVAYYGEGWGLTTDGTDLFMSDGTSTLRVIDPATFQVKRQIPVFVGNTPLSDINELEYINGEIYANVWKTDSLVRIDPKTGSVLGWINLSRLLPMSERTGREDVLNGIAYDPKGNRLFVTGKYWAKVYQIALTGPGAEKANFH
ncbi:MAG: glutaminyl-peptide cyclotransferase [Bacteroidetes bacterium]|nr:glutaminyl-peptide cyclotransferase [Bacteroidota bacterium]